MKINIKLGCDYVPSGKSITILQKSIKKKMLCFMRLQKKIIKEK